jgi:hypothetical protein
MTLPTRDQLNEAILRIHAARRSSWPDPDFLTKAEIPAERMLTEVVGWDSLRWGWVEVIEDLTAGLLFAPSMEDLNRLTDQAVAEMAKQAEDVMARIMASRAGEDQE